MTSFFRRLLVVFFVLVVASPAAADEAEARKAFKKGIELYDQKQYGPALEAFERAYAQKPSAGIKQNIALSLKGLGRTEEAARSFDEALEEGDKTLRPETRHAIERELAELTKIVATVTLKVVGEDGNPLDATVFVDDRPMRPGALRRPIRLAQGIHVFRAHVEGFADPPEKKLALLAGQPVDATFVIGKSTGEVRGSGTLTIRAPSPQAVISVDGKEVGKETWTGTVSAGTHEVLVSAPGFKTTSIAVAVSAGATVDYPVDLREISEAPPAYLPPAKKVEAQKRFYVSIFAGLQGQSLRVSDELGEKIGGSRRPFGGGLLGVRGGGHLGKGFSLELLLALGAVNEKYKLRESDVDETDTTVGHWQITPMLRWMTRGKVRFMLGSGFGLHGMSVRSKVVVPGARDERSGSGVAFSWLSDVGMQVQTGGVALEFMAFMDLAGVGTVRDDAGNRLLLSSPAPRFGGKMGVVIPF